MNARQQDVRREVAGRIHAEADPVAKRLAANNGVGVRQGQRWRSVDDAEHSPLYRSVPFKSESPWLVEAFRLAVDSVLRVVREWDRATLLDTYMHALARDKANEAADTQNALDPDCPWIDRAVGSIRDAGDDILLAACEIRFAELHENTRLGAAA